MDAFRGRIVIASALLSTALGFTGCGSVTTGSASSKVEKTTDQCAPTAVVNKYVVRWKSGAVTTETAETREQLIKEVIEPNNSQIEYAENDQIIRLRNPAKPSEMQAEAIGFPPPGNWGNDRVGAADVWAKGIQGEGVIVAVVDSGVDLSHPQLKNQIARNDREVINGIDDDHNGYVDDVAGWDFYENSNRVTDGAGHGTHVSGIIAADPTAGPVKGLAPKAKILPLDFMGDDGAGSIGDGIKAMYYAHSRGAKIINASWGGSLCSRNLRTAIGDLSSKGVLFISASGNGDDWGRGEDITNYPTYPAAFAVGLQISVGASAYSDFMAGFSNYSTTLVHLLAPGVDILSTYPNATTKSLQGTSMATPFVSAAAALLWGHRPQASAAEVREALLRSVDVGGFPVVSGGRLNVKNAVIELEKLVP